MARAGVFLGLLALAVAAGPRGSAASRPPAYEILDLGSLGGTTIEPRGINNLGLVVGCGRVLSENTHAFSFTSAAGITDLGTLGGNTSCASAVNDSGQITGYSNSSDFPNFRQRAFLYSTEMGMRELPSLGGDSVGAGINQTGQVVGTSLSTVSPSSARAFVVDGDAVADLGTLGGAVSGATAINAAQQVIGASETAAGPTHAFLYSPGTGMTDLGALDGFSSHAYGINDTGEVVGSLLVVTPQWIEEHAFLYRQSTGMVDIGTLGGSSGEALAINNRGVIVGDANTTDDRAQHAFMYTPSSGMLDLNNLIPSDSAWELEKATAINDLGQIVGSGRHNGQRRAFLLTPVVDGDDADGDGVASEEDECPNTPAGAHVDVYGCHLTLSIGVFPQSIDPYIPATRVNDPNVPPLVEVEAQVSPAPSGGQAVTFVLRPKEMAATGGHEHTNLIAPSLNHAAFINDGGSRLDPVLCMTDVMGGACNVFLLTSGRGCGNAFDESVVGRKRSNGWCEVAGEYEIVASTPGAKSVGGILLVGKNPGSFLEPQGHAPIGGPHYITSVNPTNHSRFTFGVPGMFDELAGARCLAEVFWETSGGFVVSFNDFSLPNGGLFDSGGKDDPGQDWHTPHAYHRRGRSVDINNASVNSFTGASDSFREQVPDPTPTDPKHTKTVDRPLYRTLADAADWCEMDPVTEGPIHFELRTSVQ